MNPRDMLDHGKFSNWGEVVTR